jgi:hypothetical protein
MPLHPIEMNFGRFLPLLASNCNPPDLMLPSSKGYRHEALVSLKTGGHFPER